MWVTGNDINDENLATDATKGPEPQAPGADADTQFLEVLLPRETLVRRRAFSALLRVIVADQVK